MTHRTIFCFDTPALDYTNYVAAEVAFERFCKTVPPGVRVAVDFGMVRCAVEFWPALPPGSHTLRERGNMVICMRINANIREGLEMLGLLTVPGYEYIEEGICPACRGPFDHAKTTCAKCGRFEVEQFTWRPRG